MTPIAKRIARSLGAVDKPSSRRINKVAVPRMGGIAIAAGLLAAYLMQLIGTKIYAWPSVLIPRPGLVVNYPLVYLAFVIIFITGAIDDVFQLKPLPKLIGQVIAAAVASAGGLVIGNIVNPFGPGELVLGWLAYPVTIVYLVAYVNIINLIDGLDGLASGITCIASFTMFILAFTAARLDAASLAIALAGATLGFLPYNFNPASIFLGDSGSLTLGFALGTISLLNVTRIAGLTTIIVPLIVAGIPIIDTFSAIVRRRRAHVSAAQADKGHIHHRLIDEGFNQKQAVLFIYLWTMMLSVGAVIMTQVSLWPRIVIFIVLGVASFTFTLRLHLFEPVLRHHFDPKTGRDTLVTPDDPAFKEEAERAEQEFAERHPLVHSLGPNESELDQQQDSAEQTPKN